MLQLRPAKPADFPRVKALLEEHDLPLDGVDPALAGFLVAESGTAVVGVIGLERYGDRYGLLRSAAIADNWRGRGVGGRLVERLLDDARTSGVDEIYLLTDTAARWFPKFGFEPTTRDQVPAPVGESVEFRVACPASAVVMVRRGAE